jgi:HEAT repeat protein
VDSWLERSIHARLREQALVVEPLSLAILPCPLQPADMDPARPQDTRTTPELVAAALRGDEDDEHAWEAIRELHRRGGDEEYEAACHLLRSSSSQERGRGADILAQLGTPRPNAELQARCATAILHALENEREPSVLHSMGVALGHLRDPRAVSALFGHKDHPDADVRFGVVMAMSPHAVPAAVQALVQLSKDEDEDVRNWANFGLGSMLEDVDTPELRDALVARLRDTHAEIRGEALVGLARRKDPRVVEALRRELGGERVIILAVEAAAALNDASLLPLLVRLRDSPGDADDYFKHVLDEAIACFPSEEGR